MDYKIFNTKNGTIYNVIKLERHAFDRLPAIRPLQIEFVTKHLIRDL